MIPQQIIMSMSDWRAFVATCKVAGVDPTFTTWTQWRLGTLATIVEE